MAFDRKPEMRMSRHAAVYGQMARFNPNSDLTYTGSFLVVNDSNTAWRVKFLTSGVLTFLKDPKGIDLFIAGGGGGGAQAGGGGGGGYTGVWPAVAVTPGTGYSVQIGAGGAGVTVGSGNDGSPSSALGYTAAGGKGGIRSYIYEERFGGNGGSGGGGYSNGAAGADGLNGGGGDYARGGYGQGSTTREFHEGTGTLYASGGACGPDNDGAANTGNGGDGYGYNYNGMPGGSGIVVIRNAV